MCSVTRKKSLLRFPSSAEYPFRLRTNATVYLLNESQTQRALKTKMEHLDNFYDPTCFFLWLLIWCFEFRLWVLFYVSTLRMRKTHALLPSFENKRTAKYYFTFSPYLISLEDTTTLL